VATAVFVGSYFFTRPAALRAMQMGGAALWILYGYLIHAIPVVAANALVLAAAAWTVFSAARAEGTSVLPTNLTSRRYDGGARKRMS
jgi:hypothetical protein